MTRWARANNIHKHKPADATPWSQLKASGGAGGSGSGQGAGRGGPSYRGPRGQATDPLRRTQPGQGGKKPNRKKKDYENVDVNGFMEYLQQTGQPLPRGPPGAPGVDDGLREEVATALKKDKRREDRRLKRQKIKKTSMVCFNCRKPGHGLADCPEADNDEEMGRGICYRCGSTEHEIQRCRAKVDPAMGKPGHRAESLCLHSARFKRDYPYAKCFICNQTGHLSKSCPDNPKGMYAAGGCCRVCGSVEHFQKDCPEHQSSGNSPVSAHCASLNMLTLWEQLRGYRDRARAQLELSLGCTNSGSGNQALGGQYLPNAVTVGRLSNRVSADHQDVHVPVKKAKPKQAKVVVF
ncbi:hypothetical protein JZ751_011686 [Albula glossodonta]|uniref:CCHC-type domain-containing protein n=1 Tax=Albula glossodonta TaxID=121402 RepID=A0A8T2PQB3_9TELE|nr:hypothetical protein JZ751_011686 [Albula glossodonta]